MTRGDRGKPDLNFQVDFCSVTPMRWLRTTRLLTRTVLPSALSLSLIAPWTTRPFSNLRIGTRMSSKRHENAPIPNLRSIGKCLYRLSSLDCDAFKKRISVLAVSVPAEKASLFLKSQELKG